MFDKIKNLKFYLKIIIIKHNALQHLKIDGAFHCKHYLYIYSTCLGVCLVCLCPINVKTAELIRHTFIVGLCMSPGKIYRWSTFKFCLQQNLIVIKFWKSNFFFQNPRTFFVIILQCIQRENVYNWKKKMGAKRPKSKWIY